MEKTQQSTASPIETQLAFEQTERPLVEHALEYAGRGWAVFPCHTVINGHCSCGNTGCVKAGKHPATPHGVKDATIDEAQIKSWWLQNPSYNIAVACGKKSNLFVLDEDLVDGLETNMYISRNTLRSRTGGGGAHYFFVYTDAIASVGNTVKKIANTVDTRSDGGYVILPPSTHVSGGRYEWLNDEPVADMSPQLIARLLSPTRQLTSSTSQSSGIATKIPRGKRNDILYRKGCSLRAQGLSEAEIEAVLKVMNRDRCDPPLDDQEMRLLISQSSRHAAGYLTTALCEEPDQYPRFPVEVLPVSIADFIRNAAKAINCHETFVALPLLTGFASAVGNSRVIEIKPGWQEPCIVWTGIVGVSGTGKTPGMKTALAPVFERQTQMFLDHATAEEEYEKSLLRYERQVQDWRKTKHSDDPPSKPTPPACHQLATSDTTLEALAGLLNSNPRGLLLARDELAGWIRSFDQYKSNKGADIAGWLECQTGGTLTVNRKGQKPLVVRRAAVSVTGGIQPKIVSRLLTDEMFASGFAARLLLAYPPPSDFGFTNDAVTDEDRQVIQTVYQRLWDLQPLRDAFGETPVGVTLNQDAYRCWVEYQLEQAERKRQMTDENIISALTKLDAYAARLALVVHCVTNALANVDTATIEAKSMEAGIALARWFGRETIRLYSLLSTQKTETKSDRVLSFVKVQGTVTARDIQRQFHLRTQDEAKDQLEGMVLSGQLASTTTTAANGRHIVLYTTE